MTDILVTGSSQFIGSNLCRALTREGHNVYGIDINPPEFALPDAVEMYQADLTESPEFPQVEVIVHLAAHSQVQPVVKDPSLALENIEMTKHVLSEAERIGAAVINASSRDIYGNAIQPNESEATLNSPNGYAASKVGSEAIANAYRHTRNVSVTTLRLSNVYGPRDTNSRVIPIFISLADSGEELTVYGKGKVLDFVHVDDVVNAIKSTVQRLEAVNGEAINIGSGKGIPLTDVARYISEAIDSCPGWTIGADRSGDVDRYVSDISKANALLNYQPSTDFQTGLSETIDWYLNRDAVLEKIRHSTQ